MSIKDLKGATDITTIAAAAAQVSRWRSNLAAANIANMNTAGYKAKSLIQTAVPAIQAPEGSFTDTLERQTLMKPSVYAVIEDQGPPNMQYQPNHPQANAEGYVAMPNVNIVGEMTNMMSALRSYQANLTTIENGRQMAKDARSLLGQIG